MKCVTGVCDKTISYFDIAPENAIAPFECEIGDLRQLFSYFQHRAPNVDSLKSPYLLPETHQSVLDEMLKGNELFVFCSQNAKTEDELAKVAFGGSQVCIRCKRFLCKRMTSRNAKRDETRKETDLECLLRHMRNSIAHGHVFVYHSGNYISVLLEDQNDKGNTTARIVCCQADLKKWRNILEKAIKDQNLTTEE